MKNDDLFGYIVETDDEDTDKFVLALLAILMEYYNEYSSKPPEYVVEHIEKDMDNLKNELLDYFDENYNDYVTSKEEAELLSFMIPLEHREVLDYDISLAEQVFQETINSLLSQLRFDLKTKSLVWIDTGKPLTEWNLDAHFKKAVLKLKNAGVYYTQKVAATIKRSVLDFVYEEATYDWLCLGPAPCSWCIAQSKMPPRPLDEIPYDHLNGYCGLALHEGKYSERYLDIRG